MAIVVWFALCASTRAEAPNVVVSLTPLHSLAASLMARIGKPHLLIRGVASPHHYAMRPSDVRTLRAAAVVFWVGPGLEEFLVRPLRNLAATTRIVRLDDAVRRSGGDPHIWLDPESGAAIAWRMARALIATDPRHGHLYTKNLHDLERRLLTLDRFLRDRLAPVRDRPFVVYHDAYSRLVARYGLSQLAYVARDPEIPPAARRMAEIRRRMARDGAVCLFAEPQFSAARLRPLTRGGTVRMATLDPIGAALEPGVDAYFTMMRELARSMHGCLAGP